MATVAKNPMTSFLFMSTLLSWFRPPDCRAGGLMGDAAGRPFENVRTEATALQLSINIGRNFHKSIPLK